MRAEPELAREVLRSFNTPNGEGENPSKKKKKNPWRGRKPQLTGREKTLKKKKKT
jgi:hypothetical protein